MVTHGRLALHAHRSYVFPPRASKKMVSVIAARALAVFRVRMAGMVDPSGLAHQCCAIRGTARHRGGDHQGHQEYAHARLRCIGKKDHALNAAARPLIPIVLELRSSSELTGGRLMEYLHTMIRVTDLDKSLDFFCNKLGMVEIRRSSNEKGRYTLVFLAAPDDAARAREKHAPLVELTHNWDPETYTGGRKFWPLPLLGDGIYASSERLMKSGVTLQP